MKIITIAVAAALFAACARNTLPPRVVEGKAPVKAGRKIFVKVNKGEVRITAAKAGEASWRVEFSPDGEGSLLRLRPSATEKDYDACKVDFDGEKGLTVDAVKGVGVKITVAIPANEALDAQLGAGILDIGARPGQTNAFIDAGILEYDASALPAKVCVTASVNAGTVTNSRDFDCASVGATLHGHSGVVKVK